ncbi:unnamed protein product [Rotaria sp. Silwood2]|nr:unnamed protein product [Rotaria sp. Silwood2]
MLLDTFIPMPRLILVVALLLSNAESKPTAKSKESIEDFHLNLYKSVVAAKSDDNVFLSPYSISLALAMVAEGARDKTEKELLNLLQIPSRDKLNPLAKQLMSISRLPEIKLANRLYPDESFPILPAFKKRLQKLYNSTLVSVDLNAKDVTSAINEINAWVSNQTNGHIKKALDKNDLARNTSAVMNALLMINCLLFDAKWQREFQGQNTRDGNTFYPDVGPPQEKKLTLMTRNGLFPYVDLTSEIGARMIHLPFEKKDLTFTIILPNENTTLSQVESKLNSVLLNSPTTTDHNVFISIPKWKLEFESIQFNPPATTSSLTPVPFISPTSRNIDFLNNSTLAASLSESQNNSLANITSSDSSQKAIDVLANVIEKYMSSTVSQTSHTKKRKMIERVNGESLTTMDVLMRLQQKQQAKQRKNDKLCKTRLTASNGTKKRSRKFQNPQQLLNVIDDLNESNSLQHPAGSVSTAIMCQNNMTAQSNPYTTYSSYDNSITNTTSFQPGQSTYSSYATCYRCYAIVYTNFTCCVQCNRYCCNQCKQTFFTSNTVFCEYCMIQEALTSARN